MPYLSAEEARRVYDRIGRLQDTQRLYEHRALDALAAGAQLAAARAVVEAGCGTGALAARLLGRELAPEAEYVGIDLSPRMVALARTRIRPFADRARIVLGDASERLPVADGWADRVVSAYVLDLLAPEPAAALVAEAARALSPGGLLCLVSLTTGRGPAARLVAAAWSAVWSLRPHAVGGCRPSDLLPLLAGPEWHVESAQVVTTLAIGSQLVIARRV